MKERVIIKKKIKINIKKKKKRVNNRRINKNK